jgi:aryl-alcohol dehydrogenase
MMIETIRRRGARSAILEMERLNMGESITKAAVFRPDVPAASLEMVTIGALRDDEVLVRLVATGVCHTDLTCRDGFMALRRPMVLGHEGAGIVERVGAGVSSVVIGDPVVMTFLSCGVCTNCGKDAPSYCDVFFPGNFTGRRVDGSTGLSNSAGDISGHFFGQSSFAMHSVANVRNVVKVRADAPLELLGPLGCGVQTGAGAVLNVLKPEPGSSIGIIGAGGVGLSAVMAAVIAGCNTIIVVEPRADRRALALELGATHVVDPAGQQSMPEAIRSIAAGGLNAAFDTSGIPSVIGQAVSSLAKLGKLALVTANRGDALITVPILELVSRGITIRGVSMGDSVPQEFIPRLVELVMDGRFQIQRMVRFYNLDEINQALHDQETGAVIKAILRMNGH